MADREWSGTMADGTITMDPDEYVASWHALAAPIEKLMPYWRAISFDPGLTFSTGGGHESVSVELAQAIRRLMDYDDA